MSTTAPEGFPVISRRAQRDAQLWGSRVCHDWQMVLQGVLAPPRALDANVPKEIEDVILRCLERDRDRRYVDGRALGRALERALEACEGKQRRVQSFTRLHTTTPLPPIDADVPTMMEPRGEVIEARPALASPRPEPTQPTTARWPISTAPPPTTFVVAAPRLAPSPSRNAETIVIARGRKKPWAALVAVAIAATAAGLSAAGILAHVL